MKHSKLEYEVHIQRTLQVMNLIGSAYTLKNWYSGPVSGSRLPRKYGSLNISQRYEPPQPVTCIALPCYSRPVHDYHSRITLHYLNKENTPFDLGAATVPCLYGSARTSSSYSTSSSVSLSTSRSRTPPAIEPIIYNKEQSAKWTYWWTYVPHTKLQDYNLGTVEKTGKGMSTHMLW